VTPPPPPPPSLALDIPADGHGAGLGEAHRSVAVSTDRSWLRRLLSFIGPGYLVAVGYMDPGNWATDLAGGSAFGYTLLWVILVSNLMAMLLQVLAARLGIVSGLDLAQACRRHSRPRSVIWQWLLCEIAICACDLAEVIGTAIGLKLLFGIPLLWGVGLTIADVLVILWLQQHGFRYLEALVISLFAIVAGCFAANLVFAHPVWSDVARGLVPGMTTLTDPSMLYIAIGIIGATVMPHNLYLHSATVQTRRIGPTPSGKKDAITFATIDVMVALALALSINAAILITAGAVFHTNGYHEIAELQDAYHLIGPVTGTAMAGLLFGVALLASGQSSSVTATLAGQIIMEGFIKLKMPMWARRLLTRSIVVVPTLFITYIYGESGITRLLLLSQVMLSLQLPFAMVPLIRFSSSKTIMGKHVNPLWMTLTAWTMMVLVTTMNLVLTYKALVT
jgi:manganese transport protein